MRPEFGYFEDDSVTDAINQEGYAEDSNDELPDQSNPPTVDSIAEKKEIFQAGKAIKNLLQLLN